MAELQVLGGTGKSNTYLPTIVHLNLTFEVTWSKAGPSNGSKTKTSVLVGVRAFTSSSATQMGARPQSWLFWKARERDSVTVTSDFPEGMTNLEGEVVTG